MPMSIEQMQALLQAQQQSTPSQEDAIRLQQMNEDHSLVDAQSGKIAALQQIANEAKAQQENTPDIDRIIEQQKKYSGNF